jgi:hypothetical protein
VSITLDAILHTAINPALLLLPRAMDSDAARVMLLAAGLQESRFKYRFQIVKGKPYLKGPAKSYWQHERGGGVLCVMTNPVTREQAQRVCTECGVEFNSHAIHAAIETNDVLAAAWSRLLLWADPRPLPNLDASHEEAWQCYLRCWRPGKPHRETWDEFHKMARAQVMS